MLWELGATEGSEQEGYDHMGEDRKVPVGLGWEKQRRDRWEI